MPIVDHSPTMESDKFVYGIIEKGVPNFNASAVIDHVPAVMDHLTKLGIFVAGGNLAMVKANDLFYRLITYTVIAREDENGKLLFAVHKRADGKELGFQSHVVGSDAGYWSYRDDDGDTVESDVLCLQTTTAVSADRTFREQLGIKIQGVRAVKPRAPVPIGYLRSKTLEAFPGGKRLGVIFIQTFSHSGTTFELIDPKLSDLEWLDCGQIKQLFADHLDLGHEGPLLSSFAGGIAEHISEIAVMAKLHIQINAKQRGTN